MSPIETVTAFVEYWNTGNWNAMYEMCDDDIAWHNIPMDPIQGKPAMREAVEAFMVNATGCDWEIRSIAASGNTVLTERIDGFNLRDGRCAKIRVMGTFEIGEDGRILAWRDYFDMGEFQREFA